jgi:hypothetical protein
MYLFMKNLLQHFVSLLHINKSAFLILKYFCWMFTYSISSRGGIDDEDVDNEELLSDIIVVVIFISWIYIHTHTHTHTHTVLYISITIVKLKHKKIIRNLTDETREEEF